MDGMVFQYSKLSEVRLWTAVAVEVSRWFLYTVVVDIGAAVSVIRKESLCPDIKTIV